MKKHFFVLFVVAATMAGIWVSCTNEDSEQVVESEVLDSGLEAVLAQSGIAGASFSYESWLQVDLVTRASGEQKITATCSADISALVREQRVESFELKPLDLSYIGKEKNRNRQGNYVSVIDSAMVCRFDYGAFAYDYELKFQAPVYDDGVTKQVMPYHRFESISYTDYTLTDLETAVVRGATYERKLFHQRVSAEFAGEVYAVDNYLILMKKIDGEEYVPGEPYQVSTEIVDGGCECEGGGNYRPWLKVVQHWSDGSKRELECSVNLRAEGYAITLPYKVVPNADVELLSWKWEKGRRDSGGGSDLTSNVRAYDQQYRCILEYNLFTAETEFWVEHAYYVDNVIVYPMPMPELGKVTVLTPILTFVGHDSSEKEGEFDSWIYEQTVTADFGSGILDAWVSCQLVVK